MASYAGQYGPRVLTFEDGKLFYQREGRQKYELIPMAEDLFSIEALDYFRLKIDKKDGKIMGLKGLYSDGRSDYSKSDKVIKP